MELVQYQDYEEYKKAMNTVESDLITMKSGKW